MYFCPPVEKHTVESPFVHSVDEARRRKDPALLKQNRSEPRPGVLSPVSSPPPQLHPVGLAPSLFLSGFPLLPPQAGAVPSAPPGRGADPSPGQKLPVLTDHRGRGGSEGFFLWVVFCFAYFWLLKRSFFGLFVCFKKSGSYLTSPIYSP